MPKGDAAEELLVPENAALVVWLTAIRLSPVETGGALSAFVNILSPVKCDRQ